MSGQATHLLHGRDVSFPVLKRGLLEIAHSLERDEEDCSGWRVRVTTELELLQQELQHQVLIFMIS